MDADGDALHPETNLNVTLVLCMPLVDDVMKHTARGIKGMGVGVVAVVVGCGGGIKGIGCGGGIKGMGCGGVVE